MVNGRPHDRIHTKEDSTYVSVKLHASVDMSARVYDNTVSL
jgi:hypothetical protein